MKTKISLKGKDLYSKILHNKFITICILFTIFTLLDTIPIILGLWAAKVGMGPYVHLLGRFILHSILVSGVYIFDVLRKSIKSKLLIYTITFILTWGLLLAYLWTNSLFAELHPDAYLDMTRSYLFLYLLLGVVLLISNTSRKIIKNKRKKL
ncbi:hypothetical protein HYG86_05510 [Alkalicella caledoniensis]|uniref:Uncharacterized protein n=1 Tax=Alkalicella caledoniensis TaxID=2731377 RepID=A0A7G9W6F5_ALKCA|nr:DUF6608 family protein [Alkalicella caledoniensis]QNO14267.1 hypothetical protein HYG86_05510 [Alkalicella caledoniensis]